MFTAINQHSLHTAQILHQLFFCRGLPLSCVTSASWNGCLRCFPSFSANTIKMEGYLFV